MNINKAKIEKRLKRRIKIRKKISGTATCPRLSVFRSNASMFVQIIDDVAGKTLVSGAAKEVKGKKSESALTGKILTGFELGKLIAEKAKAKKVEQVVFDRGGYKYHGRIKSLAEGAREGGLQF
ncbi:50S ribosomal protein L18 [Candidatus Parcubacteria bacterium]|nr:50S ribosomal protein L18 [Patescibacteria group bacterium]MBU4309512.1 50S ribosomal protein L18 [Patescibacteria group bacterium]MBU4432056.1 50S ribosomal protein L18 [Patescibacteria group bacterium]MBU4577218.1 50S ribosomal protein L18 [Patescibacteria group bacterium]MCG2696864.1 50S ribosomal protein L18 [Candidatus Parcubacteria bacterium]